MKILKFWANCILCAWKKSLEHVEIRLRLKKYDFLEKTIFLYFFPFFSKGVTLWFCTSEIAFLIFWNFHKRAWHSSNILPRPLWAHISFKLSFSKAFIANFAWNWLNSFVNRAYISFRTSLWIYDFKHCRGKSIKGTKDIVLVPMPNKILEM